MQPMEFQTQVNAPPEKVFEYVSDLEKHTQWTHCQQITKTTDGPVGVGATYDSRGKDMGMSTHDKLEVVEFEPNKRLAWRASAMMGMRFVWSFELRPRDGGTLLIERVETPKGALASVMMALGGKRAARKQIPEGLAKIKAKMEGG